MILVTVEGSKGKILVDLPKGMVRIGAFFSNFDLSDDKGR
jgi:hypothetical protein